MWGNCPGHTPHSLPIFRNVPQNFPTPVPDSYYKMHTQVMEVHNSKEASDFYGHGLTHSRRPRPKRGSQHEDSEQDKANDKASGNSQERNPLPLIFEISLPFGPRPCTMSRRRFGTIYIVKCQQCNTPL